MQRSSLAVRRVVRFFTNGGHDGGCAKLGHISGMDREVTSQRWDEIRADKWPMDTLRCPWVESQEVAGQVPLRDSEDSSQVMAVASGN